MWKEVPGVTLLPGWSTVSTGRLSEMFVGGSVLSQPGFFLNAKCESLNTISEMDLESFLRRLSQERQEMSIICSVNTTLTSSRL